MPSCRNLAFLGCRLLSIYVLYQALLKLGWIFGLINQYFGQNVGATRLIGSVQISVIIFVLEVILFLILWFAADPISLKVVDDQRNGETVDTISRDELLSVAIILAGIFVVIFSAATLIQTASTFLIQGISSGQLFISPAVTLGFGIVCVTGSKTLGNLITRTRRWQ